MKNIFLFLATMMSITVAEANPYEEFESLLGRYTNQDSEGQFNSAWVEIQKQDNDQFILIFNVPCGTKVTPRTFNIIPSGPISGDLTLMEDGGGQCYTGQTPRFIVTKETIMIRVDPRIRTPRFNGIYKLYKVQ